MRRATGLGLIYALAVAAVLSAQQGALIGFGRRAEALTGKPCVNEGVDGIERGGKPGARFGLPTCRSSISTGMV